MGEYINNLTGALSTQFGNQLPTVLGAIVILIIGMFVAKMIRRLVEKILSKTKIDEQIAQKLNTPIRIDKFVASLIYYLLLLFVFMVVLNILGVDGVLAPLQAMLTKFISFLPNVIGAGVIGFVGYLIATIVSEATGFLSEKLEAFSGKIGMNMESMSLSKIIKQLVFVIVFLPILIIALDTLKMDAISKPASEMLSTLLNAIPKIIAAGILLAVFYIVGKYVVTIVVDLLKNMGIDSFAQKLGLQSIIGQNSLASIIGNVAFFFILFTGLIAAMDKLDMPQVSDILTTVYHVTGKVIFGLIILMCGVFISNLAVNTLSASSSNKILVPIARFAILGIFLAFGLHTMGVAESIVNLAFGLTLGAVAVAFALSFGLGGREAAGKEMSRFFENLRK